MSSKIAWTNETWNPVVGCSKVSPGCDNCYAERMAARQVGMGYARHIKNPDSDEEAWIKYSTVINEGKWTGTAYCDRTSLDKPLHWRKPRRIFVCSMGDLFHKSVPFEFIDKVVAVLALCPQHTGQILTKRGERLLEYSEELRAGRRRLGDSLRKINQERYSNRLRLSSALKISSDGKPPYKWPDNIIGMVTAENQEQADKRIPLLLQCGFKTTGVSIEPMLGSVDLENITATLPSGALVRGTVLGSDGQHFTPGGAAGIGINWVIVGGESGPGMRICDEEWIREIVCQCQAADVPLFIKQIHRCKPKPKSHKFYVSKNMAEWPEELQVQEYPK